MHQISALILPDWLLSAIGDFGQELLEQFRSTLLYKIYFALTKAREKWLVVSCGTRKWGVPSILFTGK